MMRLDEWKRIKETQRQQCAAWFVFGCGAGWVAGLFAAYLIMM